VTETTYSRVTTASLIAAIGSALLFDRVAGAQVWAGLLGVCAAAVAIGAYLRQHWDDAETDDSEGVEADNSKVLDVPAASSQAATKDNATATLPAKSPSGRSAAAAEELGVAAAEALRAAVASRRTMRGSVSEWDLARRYLEATVTHATHASSLRLFLFRGVAEAKQSQAPVPADAVVDLVNGLFTKRGREIELVLYPDGRLVIRSPKVRQKEEEREASSSSKHMYTASKHMYTAMRGESGGVL